MSKTALIIGVTVQEFCAEAFAVLGLDRRQYVKHDVRYDRPAEVDLLLGDASKARRLLGWEPRCGSRNWSG